MCSDHVKSCGSDYVKIEEAQFTHFESASVYDEKRSKNHGDLSRPR